MATNTQKLEALKQVPLFAELSRSELKAILKVIRDERFISGAEIVREGTAGGRFYLLTSGQAKVVVRGRTRLTLESGDFFGEITVIDGGTRTATVVAASDLTAMSIASWEFLILLEEHWPIAKKVLQRLAGRVRELDRSATH